MEKRPDRKIVLAEGMIGQITIPLSPNPRKWLKEIKGRANPSGLGVSWAVSNASWGVIWPAESTITPLLNSVNWDQPEGILLRFGAVALLGVAAAKSVSTEARALKTKKFSISPPGTLLYAATGKARLTSVVEHIGDHALLSGANLFFDAGLVHNDPKLMVDSFIATSLSLSTWNLFWNRLIVNGNVDPAVKKISQIKDSVWSRIKRRETPKIEETAPVEPAFIVTPTEDLTPGVWVDLPGKNDGDQEKPLL